MSSLDLRRHATIGVLVLLARTIAMQLIVLGGNVYLFRVLDPKDFGAFAVVSFGLSFFALFGDGGLAAALIQKRQAPTQRELSSIWWLQLGLMSTVVMIVFVAAPQIARLWPDMPPDAPWLLRALSLTLLVTSLRAIHAILLERELRFGVLSATEVAMQITYYAVALPMAYAGYRVKALLAAAIAQSLLAYVAAVVARPWRPSMVFDRELVAPIFKFGMTYQGRSIIGFTNGATTPFYAGRLLGETALGLNNWAQTTAYFPLTFVGIIGRVAFPIFSRMQGDQERLIRALESAIHACAVVTLLFTGIFYGLGAPLIHIIFSDKWMPALPLLWVYATAISIGFLVPLIGSALDAIGRPGVVFRLSMGWTTLNWIAVIVALARWRSPLAFAIGYCVHVVIGNLAIAYVVTRELPGVRVLSRLAMPSVAAIVIGLVGQGGLARRVNGPFSLIAALVVSIGLYAAILFALDRRAIGQSIALMRERPIES